mgnify:CR=1 FL=1
MTTETQIASYNPFRAQLAELKSNNAALVFDYSSDKGEKEARSHIYKLRQTRAAVDKVRKTEKEESLKRGRLIDAEAAAITDEISEMIDVHQKPLDEIAEKEKARIADLQAKVDTLINEAVINQGTPIKVLCERLGKVEQVVIDASFAEFMAPATTAKEQAVTALTLAIEQAKAQEAQEIELKRLRAEAAAREQREREERIVKEAEDRAKAAAERNAKDAIELAAKREQEMKAQFEKARHDAAEANKRAEQAAKEAEDRVRQEIARKAAQEAAEAVKREADKNHKAKINRGARDALVAERIPIETAELIVKLIALSKIPHISIRY